MRLYIVVSRDSKGEIYLSKPTKNKGFADLMCESAVEHGCVSVALVEQIVSDNGETALGEVVEYV